MRKTALICVLASALLTTFVGWTSGVATAATDSKAPIIVGGQGDLGLSAGISQGFQARIDAFNKQGGLDGRKIKFLGMLDDGFSPTTNLANAQKLVEDDHVFADVPFNSQECTGSTGTFLQEHQTPYIGYAVCGSFGPTYKWGFGFEGNNTVPTVAADEDFVGIAKILHKKPAQVKLALSGLSVASVDVTNLTGAAKKYGEDVVSSEADIPLNATNYAPYVQQIISSGANAAFLLTSEAASVAFTQALKEAGFKGLILNPAAYDPDALKTLPSTRAALNGTYVGVPFVVTADNTPATRQAGNDLTAIGQPPVLTNGVAIGYWSGEFFVQALKAAAAKLGATNVTSASFQKFVANGYTFHSSQPGGMAPETFPLAFTDPSPCVTILESKGKSYSVALPYSCGKVFNFG